MTFDTTPPPLGMGAGERFTSPLRVYYYSGWYWVYDEKGYLCRCGADEYGASVGLAELLEAQATPPPDSKREFFRPAARDLVDPGYAERREAEVLAMKAKAKDSAAFTSTTPKATPASLADLEKSLGI